MDKSMITHFDNRKWATLTENYEAWWADTLDRPLLHITIHGADPKVDKPKGDFHYSLSQYGLDVPIETVIKHCEYELCSTLFLGDAYPTILPDFGAGVNAAFAGARVIARPETVWFTAEDAIPLESRHLIHQPESLLYRRISEFYEKADAYFNGDVVLGMTHLNNGIDIPAHFFDSVEFCSALYDKPKEIDRLIWESHELFVYYVKDLSAKMKHNRGYTCWGDILASEPWMCTQSDFSVMVSPEHFKQFLLPELAACYRAFPKYNFYHIDGKEQFVHLDSLLELPELQVLQWSPGVDKRPDSEWIPLFKKIREAGKKIWYPGGEDGMELLAQALGSLKGIYWRKGYSLQDEETAHRVLERFSH